MPYFERIDEQTYRPTAHVSGAWSPADQHIAPALGLLTHAVEVDRDGRRDDRLPITRLSFDILGTLPVEPCRVEVRVLRPGRTIELVEARLSHDGRDAVLLRAWLQSERDTAELAGSDLPRIPAPGELPRWDMAGFWPGGFIESVEVHRDLEAPGRARSWVRTDVPLMDEDATPTATAAGLFDIANGLAVRTDPYAVQFPNLDLSAHLFRAPIGGWLGFDTTVSFGAGGHGLTSSVLHDVEGPFGTLAQSLTVRPRA